MAQGADIGSLTAGHSYFHQWKMKFQRLNLIEAHRPGFSLNCFALSCQLVKFLSIYLQSRIHRRNLKLLPYKAFQYLSHFLLGHIHRLLFQNCSRHILGIRVDSQMKHCLIRFFLICKKIHQLGALSKSYRQNTGSIRVKSPCMSYFFHMENSPKLGYHIMGGKAFFLVNYNDSLKICHYLSCPKSCFSICSEILLITSYMEPARSQPAAFTCPPPPK